MKNFYALFFCTVALSLPAAAGAQVCSHGQMIDPVVSKEDGGKNIVTARFGGTRPKSGGGLRIHSGLDFRARTGYPLLAVDNGEITYAGYLGSAGNKIAIKRNCGDFVFYLHMSNIGENPKATSNRKFKKGDTVEAGTVIGLAGGTGALGPDKQSYPPHLHFDYLTKVAQPGSQGTGGFETGWNFGSGKGANNGKKSDFTGTIRNSGKGDGADGFYYADPSPFFASDFTIKDANVDSHFGLTTKKQYEIVSGQQAGAGTPVIPSVAAAETVKQAAAAAGKTVEEFLSDRDGYGVQTLPSVSDYGDMSPLEMLLTESTRRLGDVQWKENINKLSQRALYVDYLRTVAVGNYLREASRRKQEKIEAMWAIYLALKLRNNGASDAGQQAVAQELRAAMK